MMVDADDFVKPGIMYQKLGILRRNEPEIGLTGYIINENGEEQYIAEYFNEVTEVMSGIEYYDMRRELRRAKGNKFDTRLDHSSCSVFINLNFLNANKLRYLEGVHYLEDGEFMARVTCLARRVIFINNPFYIRTTRPDSASATGIYYSKKGRNGLVKSAKNLLHFRDTCSSTEQKRYMNRNIVHYTLTSIISVRIPEYPKYYHELHRLLKNSDLRRLDTEGCSKWHKEMAWYYNCSIHCFYLYWIFYRLRKSIRIRINRNFGKR